MLCNSSIKVIELLSIKCCNASILKSGAWRPVPFNSLNAYVTEIGITETVPDAKLAIINFEMTNSCEI